MAKQKTDSESVFKVLIPFFDVEKNNQKFEIGDEYINDVSAERLKELLLLSIIEQVS